MMRWWLAAMCAAFLICTQAAIASAEVFVYPKQGQTQQQFEQDQFACHQWAKGQTGVDPSKQVAVATPPPATGGAIRGAARGATVGVIGGAIGGDAGKGAAIGAGVGATAGLMRQGAYNRQVYQQSQQVQAQQQADFARYERAYATCMEGRGYQVR